MDQKLKILVYLSCNEYHDSVHSLFWTLFEGSSRIFFQMSRPRDDQKCIFEIIFVSKMIFKEKDKSEFPLITL